MNMNVLFEDMKEVNSRSIQAYGYTKDNLGIIFESNPNIMYVYKNVSKHICNEFDNAESKGNFFTSEIKNKFQFEQVKL